MGKGRPKGSRNRATAFQAALDKGGLEVIQKITSEALKADPTAMRLCMERLVPAAKTKNRRFELPAVEIAADLVPGISAILKAVSEGILSAQEGEAAARIIESQCRMIEIDDLEARIQALERDRASEK